MFGQFYNSSIRRYIVLMGELFSNVVVANKRNDKISFRRVPISNTSKEHFITSLNKYNNPTSQEKVAKVDTILPRMNLQLVDMSYNSLFKTDIGINSGGNIGNKVQYNPVPYRMIFELGIYTRSLTDMYQILEQILPYFQPHFTVEMTELHKNEVKINRNIKVVIQSISPDENSEGAVTDRRTLEWAIMFELTGFIYPPAITMENQIRTIYLDFFGDTKELDETINFESVDFQVNPEDVDIDEWDGSYVKGMSENKPIPTEPEPPGVRE